MPMFTKLNMASINLIEQLFKQLVEKFNRLVKITKTYVQSAWSKKV